MTRLFASELLRLVSRRVVRILAVIAAIGILIGNTIGALTSKPANPMLLADLPDFYKGIAFLLIVIGLVIGASSVGADWEQSTIGTLLVWEPRRTRVLIMRTLAIVVVVFALAILLQALFGLAFAAAAAWRGSTAGLPDAWMRTVLGTATRVAVAASIFGVIGGSIAWIGRHTAAALGAVFVYAAVVEGFLRGLVPSWSPRMLSSSLVIFVSGQAGDPGNRSLLTLEQAFVTLLVYALILLAAGLVMFRARDVT